ncbi:OB-fold domain-containing protein [Gammaproteobacteria bacterium]|nr:OB-fold domain-containing protein [Gammaproteobacteria bacterium]MDB3877458.1 OB-fold domain-containing protein [Gammaproteobacteria bacterium]MDB9906970.1 OB-fold domain-containing protein [Gammaproteobacteria bacterium]
MSDTKVNLLEAPFELSYKYKRSSGPVMSKFFEGLSQMKIFGTKSKAQKVFAPAAEYDPDTREALTEIVEVGPGGIIESWSWVNSPRSHHLLKTPFAFALIKLDGADTAMLHMISGCDESDLSIGKKVLPVWSENPTEAITDINYFILES